MSKAAAAFKTIGEVSDDLDVPKHVLRFWEARFPQIKPMKRGGGRRFYRPEEMELLRGIRHLLHGAGYTIKGVQKILREQGVDAVKSHGRTGAGSKPAKPAAGADRDAALRQIAAELEACLVLARTPVGATAAFAADGVRRRAS